MIYINNPKQKIITYEEACNVAVRNGVDRKRVYIYLAALGVRSGLARVMADDFNDYLEPVKLAVKDGGKPLSYFEVCKSCGGIKHG